VSAPAARPIPDRAGIAEPGALLDQVEADGADQRTRAERQHGADERRRPGPEDAQQRADDQ
jgi:hypothetical protein